MYYVYYLKSLKDLNKNYVGYSTDIKNRLKFHNMGMVPSTKPFTPWEIIFYEAFKNKGDAKRREQYFKTTKGRKALKIMLGNSNK